MKQIARTLTGLALAAGFAVLLPHGAHAASNVTASIDCTGTVSWRVTHAEWGQQVTPNVDGTAHVHDRPSGWWDGDGPHGDWVATGSAPSDGDVTITWTDWEGGSKLHGPIRLTVPTSCATTTTAPPVPTTVAPEPSTTAPAPTTTVAPEPSTTAPAETSTSSTSPATTAPPEPSTSATPTTKPQEPVRVTEPTVWLGTAPRPPDTPETSLLRPTPPAAAVTTVQASTTASGAPNNHTCDDADPPCRPATTAATVTQRTGRHPGTGFGLAWFLAAGLIVFASGGGCWWYQVHPRPKR